MPVKSSSSVSGSKTIKKPQLNDGPSRTTADSDPGHRLCCCCFLVKLFPCSKVTFSMAALHQKRTYHTHWPSKWLLWLELQPSWCWRKSNRFCTRLASHIHVSLEMKNTLQEKRPNIAAGYDWPKKASDMNMWLSEWFFLRIFLKNIGNSVWKGQTVLRGVTT